jgi:hypothetical protein
MISCETSLLKSVSYDAFDLVERMVQVRYDVERCLSQSVRWFRFISEIVRTGKHLRLPSDERLGRGITGGKPFVPTEHYLLICKPFHPRTAPNRANFCDSPPKASNGNSDPFENAAEYLAKFPALVTALFGIFGEDDNLL